MKGISTLTGAEKIDSRKEIARVARVSVGNVHKVKYILAHVSVPIRRRRSSGQVCTLNQESEYETRLAIC